MSNTIILYRGDDRTISLTVKKPDGSNYNLTGSTVRMYVKQRIGASDADAIISKIGTLIDPVNGVVEFYLVPDDTNNATVLRDEVPYPCDFQLVTSESKRYTVLRTSFVIIEA